MQEWAREREGERERAIVHIDAKRREIVERNGDKRTNVAKS